MPDAEGVLLEDRRAEPEHHDVEQKDVRTPPLSVVGVDERGVDERGTEREEELAREDPVEQWNRRLGAERQTPQRREQPDLRRSHVGLAPEVGLLRRREPVVGLEQRDGVVTVDVVLDRTHRKHEAHSQEGREGEQGMRALARR